MKRHTLDIGYVGFKAHGWINFNGTKLWLGDVLDVLKLVSASTKPTRIRNSDDWTLYCTAEDLTALGAIDLVEGTLDTFISNKYTNKFLAKLEDSIAVKTFAVKVKYSHESFGGYDHSDGHETFIVQHLNQKQASEYVLTLARQMHAPYFVDVVSCEKVLL
jgi:hypothetical protein